MENHGYRVAYDPAAHVLYIHNPVLEGDRIGVVTAITITSGDEWSAVRCDSACKWHAHEGMSTGTPATVEILN